MRKIVDGMVFEGKLSDTDLEVTVWESNGHIECSARPAVDWDEPVPADRLGPAGMYRLDAEELAKLEAQREVEAEEARERARERNARRAKTQCRRFIKVMGFDELLTLTYRDDQPDEALAKRHAARFFERMAQLVPGFGYCCGFEPQKRGTWHMHAAIYKLPAKIEMKARTSDGGWRTVVMDSWRVGTVIWRSIVGKDNGLCFVGGKGGRAKSARQSLAKMAGYVSKYITKHYELVPDGKKRYTHSQGAEVPKAQRTRMVRMTMREFIAFAVQRLGDGVSIVDNRLGRFKDSYWLCAEAGLAEIQIGAAGDAGQT